MLALQWRGVCGGQSVQVFNTEGCPPCECGSRAQNPNNAKLTRAVRRASARPQRRRARTWQAPNTSEPMSPRPSLHPAQQSKSRLDRHFPAPSPAEGRAGWLANLHVFDGPRLNARVVPHWLRSMAAFHTGFARVASLDGRPASSPASHGCAGPPDRRCPAFQPNEADRAVDREGGGKASSVRTYKHARGFKVGARAATTETGNPIRKQRHTHTHTHLRADEAAQAFGAEATHCLPNTASTRRPLLFVRSYRNADRTSAIRAHTAHRRIDTSNLAPAKGQTLWHQTGRLRTARGPLQWNRAWRGRLQQSAYGRQHDLSRGRIGRGQWLCCRCLGPISRSALADPEGPVCMDQAGPRLHFSDTCLSSTTSTVVLTISPAVRCHALCEHAMPCAAGMCVCVYTSPRACFVFVLFVCLGTLVPSNTPDSALPTLGCAIELTLIERVAPNYRRSLGIR